MQCFLSFGLPSSAHKQLKLSLGSVMWVMCMLDEGVEHHTVELHEVSRAVITSISISSIGQKKYCVTTILVTTNYIPLLADHWSKMLPKL